MCKASNGPAVPQDRPNVAAGLTKVRVALQDAMSEVDALMLHALGEELSEEDLRYASRLVGENATIDA